MNNEPGSSLTHFFGFLLAIAALVLMLVFAEGALEVVSFAIFGSALILLYLMSSLYHFLSKENKYKILFQKLDHVFIYILIASTYTPLTLVSLRGAWGWSIFGVIWGLATLGIILKLIQKEVKQTISIILYLIMGWLILIAFGPLFSNLSLMGILWLILGGISYTLGVLFFVLERFVPRTKWWGMHEIFHLFVIAGSFAHFWLMLKYI